MENPFLNYGKLCFLITLEIKSRFHIVKCFCSDQSLKSVLEMGVLYIAVKIVEKQL